MMKSLLALTLIVSNLGFSAENGSARIAKAVKIFTPLAESGVSTVKVKGGLSVKETLTLVALKQGYISEKEEISWVGNSNDAWEADSTNFGQTTMKGAYSYITTLDETREEYLNQPGSEKEKAKTMKQIKAAKDAFELLQNSGVKFGVVPMGAVQCGVTFAALAIIDENGKVYIFAKEGSGC